MPVLVPTCVIWPARCARRADAAYYELRGGRGVGKPSVPKGAGGFLVFRGECFAQILDLASGIKGDARADEDFI